jgi:hypothetical protein
LDLPDGGWAPFITNRLFIDLAKNQLQRRCAYGHRPWSEGRQHSSWRVWAASTVAINPSARRIWPGAARATEQ